MASQPITHDDYLTATGRAPTDDDLERANCTLSGIVIGHSFCGWCTSHNLPAHECGCIQGNINA